MESKNKNYGNSAVRSAQILKVLYPDGVSVNDYEDMLLIVRIIDKISRISTGAYDDSYEDIAGYGILGAQMRSSNDV